MSIAENIADLRKRIAAAAARAGRNPAEVTLMAVTKTFPVEPIREAYAATAIQGDGVHLNRVTS